MSETEPSLNRQVARGAAWMVSLRWALRLMGLGSTAILARLLTPGDFGLVALAMVVFALLDVLTELGFDLHLIRKTDATRTDYDTVWSLSILRSWFIAGSVFFLAPYAAAYFEDPRLTEVIRWAMFSLLLDGLRNVGVIDFTKHLQLEKEFVFQLWVKAVSVVVTVSLAFLWRDFWALVAGSVAGSATRLVLSYVLHPFRPRWSLKGCGEIFSFSKWVLMSSILEFCFQRGPTLLIGKISGSRALGVYSVTSEIASLATSELVMPIRRVLAAGFAKVSNQPDRLRRDFIAGLALIVMVAGPMTVGIGLVSAPIIRVFLGEQWMEGAPILRVLAIAALFEAAAANTAMVLWMMGRGRAAVIAQASTVSVLLVCLYGLTLRYGPVGAAAAVALASAVRALLLWFFSARLLSLPARSLVIATWRSFVAMGVMISGVLWLQAQLFSSGSFGSALLELLVLSASGALLYVAVHLGLWHWSGRPEGPETASLSLLRGPVSRWLNRRASA